MGFETRTSRSSGQCLTNWARQESVGQEISEMSFVCFMHHFICWTLFISRINRAWLYKGHEDSGWQLNVDLAQLVRHWPEDPEVLVSIPLGTICDKINFALPCVKICQKCLSWKTQLSAIVNVQCEWALRGSFHLVPITHYTLWISSFLLWRKFRQFSHFFRFEVTWISQLDQS